jgi:hypothetical protein
MVEGSPNPEWSHEEADEFEADIERHTRMSQIIGRGPVYRVVFGNDPIDAPFHLNKDPYDRLNSAKLS